jgi:hypothetical protein
MSVGYRDGGRQVGRQRESDREREMVRNRLLVELATRVR